MRNIGNCISDLGKMLSGLLKAVERIGASKSQEVP